MGRRKHQRDRRQEELDSQQPLPGCAQKRKRSEDSVDNEKQYTKRISEGSPRRRNGGFLILLSILTSALGRSHSD
jgi:hypothetical protein